MTKGARKDFIFSRWVAAPLCMLVRVLGVVFGHLGARKDFIFSGWVAGPLCRLGESAWDHFWLSWG